MKRILFPALAALLATGCVSASKFKDLESAHAALQDSFKKSETEKKELQDELLGASKTNVNLSQSKQGLEKEKAELLASTQALAAEREALRADKAKLSAEKDRLQAEKDELQRQAAAKQAQYESLVGQLRQELNDGQLKITQYKNMLTVDVADQILFDSGKADLKKAGKAVLTKVAGALKGSDKAIRVVGHTDNVPLAEGAAFASNWELSVARATTVVRFLQSQGVDPKKLLAAGRGEFSPVAPNDTPENKQKNRRIEIALLDKSLVEAVEMKPAAPATPETTPAPTEVPK